MSLTHRIEDLIMTVQDWKGRKTSGAHKLLGDRLLAELHLLADDSAGAQLPFWKRTCDELLECAENNDAMTFMRWHPVAGTMAANTTPITRAAYRLLKQSRRWPRWQEAIKQPPYGAPRPFLPDFTTNPIVVQHASHLEIFEQRTGQSLLDADCVIDLGAGYGSMCALTRRLGYAGPYIIFDQPPILALQRYYLGLNGIEADYGKGAVALCRSLDEVKIISARYKNVSLLSTWALSEMPVELRLQAEPLIASASKVMLAYQDKFEGISNRDYFTALTERVAAAWHHFEIDFCRNNFYLLKVAY